MISLPDWYLPAVVLVLGTAAGSFGNVIIHRVPKDVSLLGRSSCPSCGNQIAWYDNIPLVSYTLLRGRCRACEAPISLRYPVVELCVGLLWLLTLLRFGFSAELAAYFVFVSTLVILSAIDLELQRLPNRVLYPAAVMALFLLFGAAAFGGEWRRLFDGVLGALAYGLPMLAVGFAVPAGLGFGDIKFSAYLGLHLGWLSLMHVLLGALLGILTAGILATALLLAGRKGRKDPIPFGPFMALGAAAAVLGGEPMLAAWLG